MKPTKQDAKWDIIERGIPRAQRDATKARPSPKLPPAKDHGNVDFSHPNGPVEISRAIGGERPEAPFPEPSITSKLVSVLHHLMGKKE